MYTKIPDPNGGFMTLDVQPVADPSILPQVAAPAATAAQNAVTPVIVPTLPDAGITISTKTWIGIGLVALLLLRR